MALPVHGAVIKPFWRQNRVYRRLRRREAVSLCKCDCVPAIAGDRSAARVGGLARTERPASHHRQSERRKPDGTGACRQRSPARRARDVRGRCADRLEHARHRACQSPRCVGPAAERPKLGSTRTIRAIRAQITLRARAVPNRPAVEAAAHRLRRYLALPGFGHHRPSAGGTVRDQCSLSFRARLQGESDLFKYRDFAGSARAAPAPHCRLSRPFRC